MGRLPDMVSALGCTSPHLNIDCDAASECGGSWALAIRQLAVCTGAEDHGVANGASGIQLRYPRGVPECAPFGPEGRSFRPTTDSALRQLPQNDTCVLCHRAATSQVAFESAIQQQILLLLNYLPLPMKWYLLHVLWLMGSAEHRVVMCDFWVLLLCMRLLLSLPLHIKLRPPLSRLVQS